LFCAHPLARRLIHEAAARLDPAAAAPGAAIRASFGHGTRPEHVQRLIDFLEGTR
jgi:selenocysteine lyase/cysteine desulfurase